MDLSGALGSCTTPPHCSSVPPHLPRGSSSGRDSRGSGRSSSSTEDSTGTSTLQSAGAEGGPPGWSRSLSASLQERSRAGIELNMQVHASGCNVVEVWWTQLLNYRLRVSNIQAKKKKKSLSLVRELQRLATDNNNLGLLCFWFSFFSVCKSVTVGWPNRKLQEHLRRTMSFTSLSGSPDVSPGASMVQ